ncbi:HD domain-containing protein [Caldivirga sp. UBA161]|uniref:HD domain-containing protein n=1 Tax=Caldivirga sp. UBA161 TaxID=1915569 RepID=UPI0025C2C5CF|nr:HD domain-containing protein [Caldivirga sp. UBA161]
MLNLWRLLKLVDSLAGIPRIGWVNAGVRGPETVAEHTLLASYIAASLAKLMGLDAGKASLLALIHDAAESVTGNVSRIVRDKMGLNQWRLLEANIVGELGFGDEFNEYVNLKSPEAIVVAISDKLATLIRACQYRELNYGTSDLVRNYLSEVKELLNRVNNKELNELLNDVLIKCSENKDSSKPQALS